MFDKELIRVKNLPQKIHNGAIYSIEQNSVNSYTHSFFKYPCKFIPEIPKWGIKKYIRNDKQIIFDPFAGSGTTILEGCIHGNKSFYTEIDEVATLITKVKTHKFSSAEIKEIKNLYKKIIKTYDDNDYVLPKIDNLLHWFPEENAINMAKLLNGINKIDNSYYRDFFKVCFASIIKKCSFCDDSSPKPYVSTKVKKQPSNVIDEFKKVFKKYIDCEEELSKKRKFGKPIKAIGDALNFKLNEKIDIAITSPPYINAFDYGRTMRLENIWLDLLDEESLRKKKSDYVGTEKIVVKNEENDLSILNDSIILRKVFESIKSVDSKRALIVKKFFEDMRTNLLCVWENLNPNGYYMIVIGNSNIRKVEVESSKILVEIATKYGFSLESYFSYIIQNPYISIPRKGKGGKISYDNIIVLKKEVKNNGTTK